MRLVLDSGALIALERGDRAMWRAFAEATARGTPAVTIGPVVGQVWRGSGPRQALLARAISGIQVCPVDLSVGRAAGVLLGEAKTSDVVDASLVAVCEDGDLVYTSDPGDLSRLARCGRVTVEIVPT